LLPLGEFKMNILLWSDAMPLAFVYVLCKR